MILSILGKSLCEISANQNGQSRLTTINWHQYSVCLHFI